MGKNKEKEEEDMAWKMRMMAKKSYELMNKKRKEVTSQEWEERTKKVKRLMAAVGKSMKIKGTVQKALMRKKAATKENATKKREKKPKKKEKKTIRKAKK